MAIDEIEGETGNDTNKEVVPVAPDYNQLEENDQSTQSDEAHCTVTNLNCTGERDDEIVFMESENRSGICLVVDDDHEQSPEDNLGTSPNDSLTIDKIPSKTPVLENSGLHESPHGIFEEDFENFCTFSKFTMPVRQYGRKQKKDITNPVQHGKSLASSSGSTIQVKSVLNINKNNSMLEAQEESDGLKPLSEIHDLTFWSPSKTAPVVDEVEVADVEDKTEETSGNEDHYNSNSTKENGTFTVQNEKDSAQQIQATTRTEGDKEDKKSNDGLKTLSELSDCIFSLLQSRQKETRQHSQPNKNKIHKEKENELEQGGSKVKDIKFHLNKIFESNKLNKERVQTSPVVVKMGNTPIIISENGVVTVIYKPDKVKLRRSFRSLETASKGRSFRTEERMKSNSSKRKEGCSSRRYRQVQPNEVLAKSEDLSLAVKRQQISRIGNKQTRHPPIGKVKFEGQMVYKCTLCDFVHPTRVTALRRHMLRHQPADSITWFYCDLCNYRAKRKGNLKVHMLLHRNPDELVWYKCETCDKRFKHKNGLYSHEKRHAKREELEQYLCDQCSYKTPFKHTLLRHKINHEPTDEKKLLLCSLCSYTTYNKYYLSRHRQAHSEPIYKCLMCTYEAKYKSNLENHMKRHFPKEELLYCDSCDYSTIRRYTLTKHTRNVHHIYNREEDQEFFCHNCSFQTRFKRCLVKHMAIHCGISGDKEMLTKIKTEVTSD